LEGLWFPLVSTIFWIVILSDGLFRLTTPWSHRILSWYSILFDDASPTLPCGNRDISQNSFRTWDPLRPWTSHDYVVTCFLWLTDTFPLSNLYNVIKYWFVELESSGPSPAPLSFEQRNTKLLSEMSPPPYFKSTSDWGLGKHSIRKTTAPPVRIHTFRF